MKNKISIQNYLFTPFRYIAGIQSLIAGLFLLLILSALAYFSQTIFDGALDTHYVCLSNPSNYYIHLLCLLISWISLVIVLYIAARIFSRSSIRLIDMAGTLALARFPQIFLALWGFIPNVHLCLNNINPMDNNALQPLLKENMIWLIFTGLFTIIFAIWYIALLYNAFSTSGNLKGSKGAWVFAIGLIISEALSKLFIFLLIK